MQQIIKETKESKNRDGIETLNTILTLSVNGIRKTHLMYAANLSHIQLKKFTEILTSKQLLEKYENIYRTTSLGRTFMEKYKELKSLMGEKNTVIAPTAFTSHVYILPIHEKTRYVTV